MNGLSRAGKGFILITLAIVSVLTIGIAYRCTAKQAEQRSQEKAPDVRHKPDITIADLAVSECKTKSGGVIRVQYRPRVTGRVSNGFVCDVHFTSDPKSTTRKNRIATQAVAPKGPARAMIMIEHAVSAAELTGQRYVVVIADPDNEVSESNENNNRASKPTTTLERPTTAAQGQRPEMVSGVALENLALSKTSAADDERVLVTFGVRNTGQTRLVEVPFTIYLETQSRVRMPDNTMRTVTDFDVVDEGVVRDIAIGATKSTAGGFLVPWNLTPTEGGNRVLVDLDPNWRDDSSDNRASANLVIRVSKRPDLVVSISDQQVVSALDPGSTQPYKKAKFKVTVRNAGNRMVPGSTFAVHHTRRVLGSNPREQIGTTELPVGRLHSGEAYEKNLVFKVHEGQYGIHDFHVVADSDSQYIESSETNNSASAGLNVTDPTPGY